MKLKFKNQNMFLIVLLSISFLIRSSPNCSAQEKCLTVNNKEAIKNYEKGTDKNKYKKEERLAFLKKAIALVPDYVDANFAYAQELIKTIVVDNTSFEALEPYFLEVIENCPKYHSDPYYYLGFSYYEQEKYVEAEKYLHIFIRFLDDDEKKFSKYYEILVDKAKLMVKNAKFYEDIYKHPVPFEPKLVEGICTQKDEYLPTISPDNELALFTRKIQVRSKDMVWETDKMIEVFSYSKRNKNNSFDQGKAMEEPFNKNSNEGGATVSIDNKHLYYTICKDEGGPQLNCDIYYSDLVDGQWSEIKNLGTQVNDPLYWDSQPSIAADGKTLYFASNRKGGLGGLDIYKTVRDATSGIWSAPVNLGNKINTTGNEKSPFMHSDSETLYFSSDGQPGLGGFDIFYIRKNEKGEWDEPKNIGYPINTEADDLGFFVSTDGKLGYFASNNSEKVKGRGIGGWDVYCFDLYEAARPEGVAFVKGEIKNEAGEKLTGASVEIKNASTKEKTDVMLDTIAGEYTAIVNLKKKDNFIVTVKKNGYAFNSQIISILDSSFEKPVIIDFNVKSIKAGEAYTLNNIYYKSNSAELEEKSNIVIDEFMSFLKANPTIKIEIHGHTDNVGEHKNNMALASDRAFTVYNKLLDLGVPKSQLTGFKGFGETQPIAPNDSEAHKAKNRRTEFIVMEK